jgi:hypothetical protein
VARADDDVSLRGYYWSIPYLRLFWKDQRFSGYDEHSAAGFPDEDIRQMSTMRGLFIACVVLLSASCHVQRTQNTETDSPELIVAAAANLTDAFAEIGARFTSETGIRVVFSFGATADLAKQVENGAPFDVFAAADTAHI